MTITVNNVELFYEVTGEGAPLILVHGNSEHHRIFNQAVEILKDHFTCYAIDSRGHGQSEAVSEFHYDDMADDVLAFIDALGLEHVSFYGFSDGGIIGLLAAAKDPRIENLIISGANLSPVGVKKIAQMIMKLMFWLHHDPKVKLMLTEPDIQDELLKSIGAHTLVLAGEKDVILESETRHIAEMIPDAALKILPGEDHGSYIIHSTKIADEILAFLKP